MNIFLYCLRKCVGIYLGLFKNSNNLLNFLGYHKNGYGGRGGGQRGRGNGGGRGRGGHQQGGPMKVSPQ